MLATKDFFAVNLLSLSMQISLLFSANQGTRLTFFFLATSHKKEVFAGVVLVIFLHVIRSSLYKSERGKWQHNLMASLCFEGLKRSTVSDGTVSGSDALMGLDGAAVVVLRGLMPYRLNLLAVKCSSTYRSPFIRTVNQRQSRRDISPPPVAC